MRGQPVLGLQIVFEVGVSKDPKRQEAEKTKEKGWSYPPKPLLPPKAL